MPDAADERDDVRPLAQRVQALNLSALPDRLAALDQERERRGDATPPSFDAPEAEEALARLQALTSASAAALPAHVEAVVSLRAHALKALLDETRLKMAASPSGDILSQRLRHLAEALSCDPRLPSGSPEGGGETSDDVRRALADFDVALQAAQLQARALLGSALGLEMMQDQTGLPLDPLRHNITASVSGDDRERDNTVATQEAPGWTLHKEVLVPADVVRYTSSTGGAPALPSLDELQSHTIDPGLLGRKGQTS